LSKNTANFSFIVAIPKVKSCT